jgi:hypothetical protein
MKKLIYSLIACFFLTTGLQAQNAQSTELNLQEVQKEKYLTIENDRKQAMLNIESLRKSNSDTYAQKRDKIMHNADMKIKAILDQEQWAVYERLIKQRNELLNKIK